MMNLGKWNYRKGVTMSFQPQTNCALGARRFYLMPVVFLAIFSGTAEAFKSTSNSEVSPTYKARIVGDLHLGAYKDELIECSALAGIHTWIGDSLGDSGAVVRTTLNRDYWTKTSKDYLSLAEQASGEPDLSQQTGVRMRVLAAQYRDLTESPEGTANWSGWYDLVDRCNSWRPDPPSRAFFDNGRKPVPGSGKAKEVARAPF
jgi:hypothetical protein